MNDEQGLMQALTDAAEKMDEAIEALRQAERAARHLGLDILAERIRRGPAANLQTARSDDHDWLGRDSITVADLIDEAEEECFSLTVGDPKQAE